MSAEQGPLNQIKQKESAATIQLTTVGVFKSSLSSFQGTLADLENAASYTSSKASFADPSVASVTLAAGADTGGHTLEVTSLAGAQRLKSGTAFKAITDTVGTGSLVFNFGAYDSGTNTVTPNAQRPPLTVVIDPAHNTVQGVRDAINAAKIGVSASVVNDGTGYRLVLASSSTGTQNAISISTIDDDTNSTDNSGLSQFAYDPTLATTGTGKNMSEVVAAKDAQFLMDGIAITKPSNTVTDVLSGTTLTLLKTNTGAPTSLSVNQDTSQVQTAVSNFVNGYNALTKAVSQVSGYDTTTTPGTPIVGPLLGDAMVRSLSEQVRSTLTQIVSGISGGYHALAQIGITSNRDGTLSIDSGKLQTALSTDPQAVQALFATHGSATDSQVSYASSGTATPAGQYAVNVTQLATHGSATGSGGAGLSIDSSNDALTVSVNGTTTSISLNHATYLTADALAAAVQSQLNGSATFQAAGVTASVSANNGVLTLASDTYGSTSKVALLGGTGQANLFGSGPVSTDGLDVAGTIGGVTALGAGQSLLGTNGLNLKITGGSTGDRGTVQFTKGVAVQLDQMLSKALGNKGVLQQRTDSINAQLKSLSNAEAKENASLLAKQTAYTTQFTTLDQLITTMNSTMSYLTQQLSALQSSTSTK